MTRRCSLLLVLALVLVDLVVFASPVVAAGAVSVSAWTCSVDVDATSTDPVDFAAACPSEAIGLSFGLTVGDVTRHRDTGPNEPARWPLVNGPFTLLIEDPPGEAAVVFCTHDGEAAERFDAPAGEIAGNVADSAWDCQWYRLPANAASPIAQASPSVAVASPVAASATPTATSTATATTPPTVTPTATATATATTAPTSTPTPTATPTMAPSPTATPTTAPSATPSPTATPTPAPTATPTAPPSPTPTPLPTATQMPTATATFTATATPRADPRATATAVASAIAEAEPDYQLPIHALAYSRGEQFNVYPDPKDAEDVAFAVANFVVDVRFVNPDPGPDGVWDYGFLFGPTDGGQFYRVYVRSDGRWLVDLDTENQRDGEARRLDLEDGGSNTLRLIVAGDRGILIINDRLAGSFELQDRAENQKLWLATTNVDAKAITFFDLKIWSFS